MKRSPKRNKVQTQQKKVRKNECEKLQEKDVIRLYKGCDEVEERRCQIKLIQN